MGGNVIVGLGSSYKYAQAGTNVRYDHDVTKSDTVILFTDQTCTE